MLITIDDIEIRIKESWAIVLATTLLYLFQLITHSLQKFFVRFFQIPIHNNVIK